MTDGLTIECYDDPVRPERHVRIRFAFRLAADGVSTDVQVICEDAFGEIVQCAALRLPMPVKVLRVKRDLAVEYRRARKAGQKADGDKRDKAAGRVEAVD